MLDLPDVVDSQPVGELDLLERLVDQLLLVTVVPAARELELVEETEPHATRSGSHHSSSA